MKELQDWTEDREAMSLLADGRLRGDALDRALELYVSSEQARLAWEECHLIGDALRSAELAAPTASAEFVSRWRARVEQSGPGEEHTARFVSTRHDLAVPAANDGVFRWKFVAGFASVMAVASVGWTLLSQPAMQAPAGAQVAGQAAGAPVAMAPQAAPAAPVASPGNAPAVGGDLVVVAGPQGNLIRDPRLQELLAAHKQFGGTSALQAPSGFLRNATFEAPAR